MTQQKEVAVYMRTDCQYCDYIKEVLTERGIVFREIDVTDDAVLLRAWVAWASGQQTLPQIFIAGESIGGYADLMTLDAVGALRRLCGLSPEGTDTVPQ